MKSYLSLLVVCLTFCLNGIRASAGPLPTGPRDVSLPSAAPSGIAINDQVVFRYFPVMRSIVEKTPAVILLHHLGGTGDDPRLAKFALALNRQGFAAVAMTLPYHGRRRIPDLTPNRHWVSDAATVAQAFSQSASDVSTVVTWLTNQPGIDANRIGAAGVSLGAFVVHLAMGRDARIRAGVAALGAGNLANIFVKSHNPTAADIETLRPVDPLTYATRNRPRHVLMIQAARDELVPPRYSEELWEALGRPPIQWEDVNHYGLALSLNSVIKTTIAYLETALSDGPVNLSRVPHVRAIPIKVSLISGLDTRLTPAVQYQFFGLGTRKHMALLHADAGLGLRGPFIGMAATINRHLDIGVGRRVFGNDFRLYISVGKVF